MAKAGSTPDRSADANIERAIEQLVQARKKDIGEEDEQRADIIKDKIAELRALLPAPTSPK